MANELIRLCCFVIREDFGDLIEVFILLRYFHVRISLLTPIFSTKRPAKVLFEKGRLPAALIARYSSLPLEKVKECLFILIQHNLVYWAREVPDQTKSPIFYQIDSREVLSRIKFGVYLNHTRNRFGNEGQVIITYVLLNGKASFKSLVEARNLSKRTKEYKTLKEKYAELVTEGYLKYLKYTDALSAQDKQDAAEQRELAKMTTFVPTKKEKAEARAKVAELDSIESAGGRKRKKAVVDEDHSRLSKQPRTEDVFEIIEDAQVRVNYERFNILARNDHITSFVEERINPAAKLVMKVILELADEKRLDAEESRAMSAQTIIRKVPTEDILEDQIELERQDPSHEYLVSEYLDLLVEDGSKFIRKKDDSMSGLYSVRYKDLIERLKQRKLESILQEKYGSMAVRIYKILQAKGKLEEKNIASLAMLTQADARKIIDQLFVEGLVELQEVPKAADRAPSRTYYLWYAEPERCYQKILTCLYRTLGNIHEQRMYEKEGYARLIERRAIARLRSTMHLMTPEEKEQLRIFDQSMERLDVAALRIVNLVMILTNYR
ncbi:3669_t:CDS:2 [Paraglomus brasilianum]|uniref:DNA-directed RNA polymerase III subunit RPC3 n=1 Tax=Paraglomus brasilianum TaxID=144538 RepID=A0A9N9DFK2_9GLOM|nr:3669_t:CDS:2 [Paraglomus brasilianum]